MHHSTDPKAILTADQKQFWQDNGYLRLEQVFTPEQVQDQSNELERMMQEWGAMGQGWRGPWRKAIMEADEADQAKALFLAGLQNYSATYLQAVVNPTLTGAVSTLLGDTAVEFHHSILHAKAPGLGTPFPMHQDWPFYPHWGPGCVAAIMHVDAANEDNGCLSFLPGSHKNGPLQHVLHTVEDYGEYEQPYLPLEEYPLESAVLCPADAGDVVFFNVNTVHGSAPNRTDGWRRLIRVVYRDPENLALLPQHTHWTGPTHNRSKSKPSEDPRGMIVHGKYHRPETAAEPSGPTLSGQAPN
jgi:phytanoyl-CoA hydroxylase